MDQSTREELHKPVVKKFRKRKVYVKGIEEIFAADLVDMQAFSKFNNGVKYLLTVIDVFSRYGWMVPLKTKTGLEVANALKIIFKHRKSKKLWVDSGKEFTIARPGIGTFIFHRKRRKIQHRRKVESLDEREDV